MFIFQAIFSWSAYPMSLIEDLFIWCKVISKVLPAGPLVSLLVDGVLAGLSGVMVFIPQIAILVRADIYTGRYRLHVACYLYDG
jgi:ferrous iron transport protein B